jgi:hypothetical protein
MNSEVPNAEIEALARRAVACSACFEERLANRAEVDLAQPRWIGRSYWVAEPRVAIVMLNPGSGEARSDSANARLRSLLHGFANGTTHLDEIFDHQGRDIPNRGNGGSFKRFFLEGAGLQLDQIALANIAWCATKGNVYPGPMLKRCFERHTRPLLTMLRPDVIVLSGGQAHAFARRIGAVLPNARLIYSLHYAHREGRIAERLAAEQLRSALVG